jgi:hypothetical protein
VQHTILTFITRVKSTEYLNNLKLILNQVRKQPEDNVLLPLATVPSLHFASFAVFEFPNELPHLVFESNFDGTLEEYLDQLYKAAGTPDPMATAGRRDDGETLHRVYECCEGYARDLNDPKAGLLAYLRAKLVRPRAYHIGNVGRSALQIRREKALRDHIQTYLDNEIAAGTLATTPDGVRTQIQGFVQNNAPWAEQTTPRQTPREHVLPYLKLGAVGLGAAFVLWRTWKVALPLLGLGVAYLRYCEERDVPLPPGEAHKDLEAVTALEDNIVQNHLASLIPVKTGLFRRTLLPFVLFVVNLVARTSTKGELSGIPSIHFAHWSLVDGGSRLLFLSNYDGSWENYLDDFIDKASVGLTGIWSNTEGFPRTRFLTRDGARNGTRFKQWARWAQSPTLAWYSAYQDLTVQAIDNNSAIREELLTPLQSPQVQAWLRRF